MLTKSALTNPLNVIVGKGFKNDEFDAIILNAIGKHCNISYEHEEEVVQTPNSLNADISTKRQLHEKYGDLNVYNVGYKEFIKSREKAENPPTANEIILDLLSDTIGKKTKDIAQEAKLTIKTVQRVLANFEREGNAVRGLYNGKNTAGGYVWYSKDYMPPAPIVEPKVEPKTPSLSETSILKVNNEADSSGVKIDISISEQIARDILYRLQGKPRNIGKKIRLLKVINNSLSTFNIGKEYLEELTDLISYLEFIDKD